MKENLFVSASPHVTSPHNSVRRIMIDVLVSLCPVVIAAVFFFGYAVAINIAVAVGACIGFELLYDVGIKGKFKKGCMKNASIKDGSAAVTGVILALNFPSFVRIDAWDLNIYSNPNLSSPTVSDIVFSFDTVIMLILASLFAIVLVKMLFGGIGKNFVNPAAAGRVFVFLMVGLTAVQTVGLGLDASTGATWLDGRVSPDGSTLLNMFIGNTGSAAVGETCVIAVLIGFIYLVVRKVIDFKLPLVIMGSTFVFALLFDGLIKQHLPANEIFSNALAHVMSGGLMFGAVYMATDYATSPNTGAGRVIFGVGIALITVLIRVFGGYPEGMSFAILIMNIVTPLIDRYVYPRPFGFVKEKKEKRKKDGEVKA